MRPHDRRHRQRCGCRARGWGASSAGATPAHQGRRNRSCPPGRRGCAHTAISRTTPRREITMSRTGVAVCGAFWWLDSTASVMCCWRGQRSAPWPPAPRSPCWSAPASPRRLSCCRGPRRHRVRRALGAVRPAARACPRRRRPAQRRRGSALRRCTRADLLSPVTAAARPAAADGRSALDRRNLRGLPGSLLDLRHHVPGDLPESERSLSLASAAGFPPDELGARLAVRGPLPDVTARVGTAPYVVVHPGAVPARRPTAGHSQTIVAALLAAGDRVVVTGRRMRPR